MSVQPAFRQSGDCGAEVVGRALLRGPSAAAVDDEEGLGRAFASDTTSGVVAPGCRCTRRPCLVCTLLGFDERTVSLDARRLREEHGRRALPRMPSRTSLMMSGQRVDCPRSKRRSQKSPAVVGFGNRACSEPRRETPVLASRLDVVEHGAPHTRTLYAMFST